MFTGIIQAVGAVKQLQKQGGDVLLQITCAAFDFEQIALGDSIAVNGVCLTVVQKSGDGFGADVSVETLEHTSLKQLASGAPVNLECAATPTTPLGGHLVSGHVDGVGEIVALREEARSTRYAVRVPAELAKYIAKKGSVCIDGVSLTVNDVSGAEFGINIIPHTQQHTIFAQYRKGSAVNIEVDVIARYVERLLLGERAAEQGSPLSVEFLAEHGFAGKR